MSAGIAPRQLTSERVAEVIGTVHPRQVVAVERAYIAAFFDLHLRDRASKLLKQPSPRYPEIQFLGR
jgi:hypothetical protein